MDSMLERISQASYLRSMTYRGIVDHKADMAEIHAIGTIRCAIALERIATVLESQTGTGSQKAHPDAEQHQHHN
jgi:hypothetical protein